MEPKTIARRRVAVGLTQAQLANFIGVSRSLVELAETGRLTLRPVHVARVNTVLTILEHAHQDAREAVAR